MKDSTFVLLLILYFVLSFVPPGLLWWVLGPEEFWPRLIAVVICGVTWFVSSFVCFLLWVLTCHIVDSEAKRTRRPKIEITGPYKD